MPRPRFWNWVKRWPTAWPPIRISSPPAPAEEINESLAECQSALDAVVAAKAALKEAVATKDGKFETLEVRMKKDFRYAEDAVDKDDAKLARIGWSGRHAPTPLAVPGQARSLHLTAQGGDWLEMDWKKPAGGGRVATYRIQRQEAGSGPWTLVEIAMETEARIADQARGSRLEYCVVAANKTGEGEMSNTVTVSL
uniref:Fibronectin type III domain-containing protein n=1 Tax=Candidatus Kentrum sp. SD TaxID=2126332 RepID=A0A450Y7U1_9GAMM|nr:MAG: Fibronectin type III domain-containing protein [Candidatus Kentron sp. SD]VFK41284.1 MAG: Fibronectin type III domain-containing protein [Candidatus Kentron sp. SD]